MPESLIFHYRQVPSFIGRLHPLAKLGLLMCLSVILSGASPGMTAFIGFLLVITAFSIRLPILRVARECLFFLVLACAMGLSHWFSSHDLILSVTVAARFLLIVMGGIIMADTTAPDDMARAVGTALSWIPGLKSWRLASTMELTISIIPLIFDVAIQSREARTARGERGWRHPVRRISGYVMTLFVLLLDKMEDMSVALEGRSFEPDTPRPGIKWHFQDTLFFFCSLVVLAGAILYERNICT
ncbi:energy-coupling factor transporter transmembrane component T family protein [Parasphaerochaeta coccoides]|uniref:Cobalt transport protein n=1 Tax=Parasphaerochaeta coccoides (strain ATCC BAA-1237 / DSM 17374 / SPN1) TaxID=760011 RepID=F4GKD9_PARC1|nr:energy-coupling factor transporter transmembrane component T [Parasphaerochaeta coccoides]AEC02335.1 cobalt transport protein [Parasphaerochaeta coccoides DSM 17374]